MIKQGTGSFKRQNTSKYAIFCWKGWSTKV